MGGCAMSVRDRLALMVVGAHAVAWLAVIVAMVLRDRTIPEMAWAILPSGVTACLLAVYGKDYVYRGRHERASGGGVVGPAGVDTVPRLPVDRPD